MKEMGDYGGNASGQRQKFFVKKSWRSERGTATNVITGTATDFSEEEIRGKN